MHSANLRNVDDIKQVKSKCVGGIHTLTISGINFKEDYIKRYIFYVWQDVDENDTWCWFLFESGMWEDEEITPSICINPLKPKKTLVNYWENV